VGALIVVTADKETQKSRLMARNSLTEEEAEVRIASQAPLEDKVSVADFIISNGRFSTDEALRARVLEIHNLLLSRFK
jgi:dephospho-CoA kinase